MQYCKTLLLVFVTYCYSLLVYSQGHTGGITIKQAVHPLSGTHVVTKNTTQTLSPWQPVNPSITANCALPANLTTPDANNRTPVIKNIITFSIVEETSTNGKLYIVP